MNLGRAHSGMTYVTKSTVNASTADTTYSLLPQEQVPGFFSLLVDTTSAMTKGINVVKVKGSHLDLSNVDTTVYTTVGGTEGATLIGTANESLATFGGRRLSPVELRSVLPVSLHRFQYVNKLGKPGAITDLLTKEMMVGFQNNVEIFACQAEDGTANPCASSGNIDGINGFHILADSGHLHDHAGGNITTALFRDLWAALPSKWRKDPQGYRFFVPDLLFTYLADLLAQRGTAYGDLVLQNDGVIKTIFGTPLEPVINIPTNLAGTGSQSASVASHTYIILAKPDNMYIGYNPNVFIGTHPEKDLSKVYVNLYCQVDFEFENIDAVAKAYNVVMAVTY